MERKIFQIHIVLRPGQLPVLFRASEPEFLSAADVNHHNKHDKQDEEHPKRNAKPSAQPECKHEKNNGQYRHDSRTDPAEHLVERAGYSADALKRRL